MNSKFITGDAGAMVPGQDYLESLGMDALDRMQAAADSIIECERILTRTGDTVVTELLRTDPGRTDPGLRNAEPTSEAPEGRHIPEGDVYDPVTHGQYYFHVHRMPPADSRDAGADLGHFHTFLRQPGMPPGLEPLSLPPGQTTSDGSLADPFNNASHLVAVGLGQSDGLSSPPRVVRLFATNRWVTGGSWYRGEDVLAMLNCFEIDIARPSWLVNHWLSAVLRVFRPQVMELTRLRDIEVARLCKSDGSSGALPLEAVLDDQRFTVLSEIAVDMTAQFQALRLARRSLRRLQRENAKP